MNEIPASEHATDDEIEIALRSYPLTPTPPNFSASVIKRISRVSAVQPRPHFRLSWLDFALSLFAAIMPLTLYIAWRSIPSWFQSYLGLQARYWLQAGELILVPVALFTLALVSTGLVGNIIFRQLVP